MPVNCSIREAHRNSLVGHNVSPALSERLTAADRRDPARMVAARKDAQINRDDSVRISRESTAWRAFSFIGHLCSISSPYSLIWQTEDSYFEFLVFQFD